MLLSELVGREACLVGGQPQEGERLEVGDCVWKHLVRVGGEGLRVEG